MIVGIITALAGLITAVTSLIVASRAHAKVDALAKHIGAEFKV